MKKIFIENHVRNLINQVSSEEITFSRFVEILNQEADLEIQSVKKQKIHLQSQVDNLTDRLIDSGIEKPAIRIDQSRNA